MWHVKGIVNPKIKISQRFNHTQGILGVSDLPLSVIFHIVLSVAICIITVNVAPVSEKKVSIHHKTTPHGSGVLIKAFWSETMR